MAHQPSRQSFLERLTGTVRVDEEEGYPKENDSSQYQEHHENDTWQDHSQDVAEEESDDDTPNVGQLAIDMYLADNELIIQSMIAGVTPEHLSITINRDSVIIKGRRVEPEGIADDQYTHKELYWGEFERVIELPFEINTEGAEAVEKYGLLIIRLPRLDTQKTQRLEVKSI